MRYAAGRYPRVEGGNRVDCPGNWTVSRLQKREADGVMFSDKGQNAFVAVCLSDDGEGRWNKRPLKPHPVANRDCV